MAIEQVGDQAVKATWEGDLNQLKGLVTERAITGETMLLNMGPHHPSTHGVLRLLLELDGEELVTVLPDVGFLHTGIEKNIEDKTYEKGVPLTDRMDYLSPMSNNMVFCMAIEKMIGLDVPERAQTIRVVLLELSRIASHMVWLGTQALDMGAMSVFLYCFREREKILRIFEMVSGQRIFFAGLIFIILSNSKKIYVLRFLLFYVFTFYVSRWVPRDSSQQDFK